jgi:thioredoxin reductase
MRPGDRKEYDVLVVGGGAAGLSAALVLLRARRTVVLVDAGGPRNAPAAHMHGFLSRDGMPPRDLLAAGRSEVSGYGGSLVDDTVVGVEPGFHVRLANASPLRARRLLVATGMRDEPPDIPGVRERWGRDLLHGLELGDGTLVPRAAVFVRPRFVPNAGLLTGLGCAVDADGWVVHDPTGRTPPILAPRSSGRRGKDQRRSPSMPTWSTRTSSAPRRATAPATGDASLVAADAPVVPAAPGPDLP